ncbi:MAG: T9SS type A sorting domain-containing protein [Caldithrix sp.]|nr:T9SS type A sorting domain-containing protein [Caldithrix sp.]
MIRLVQNMKSYITLFSFSLLASLSPDPSHATVDFTSSNLPIVVIDTHGQNIPYDNPRIIADMFIIHNGPGQRNHINDPANDYSGNISIEIRGQSSAGWDKKSYALETQHADGSNRNVSVLGLPVENDWILYAPYYDRSLMRNVLTYRLARQMGWYASRTVYCELMLNGEYRGIYVWMEKIKQDNDRIDIADLNTDEISGDDVTGGYILRIDKEPWRDGFDSSFPPYPGASEKIRYQYHYPRSEDIVMEQEAYIQSFIDAYESLMYQGHYSDPDTGYTRFINTRSFIDYLILNELSRNVDGYRLSAYFYKDKNSNGGKLHAGPVWDYNFSFGNVGYYESWLVEGWQLLYFADNAYFQQADNFLIPFWWKTLFFDEAFIQQLQLRWQALRQDLLNLDTLYAMMDQFADTTAEARERNFERWPGPGVTELGGGWFPSDPRSNYIQSYADELSLTKGWIEARIKWMDKNIPQLSSLAGSKPAAIPETYVLQQNFPNPFNASTLIPYRLSSAGDVQLRILNTQGKIVRQSVNRRQPAGKHTYAFHAQGLASGIYIYTLVIDGRMVRSKKMLLIR